MIQVADSKNELRDATRISEQLAQKMWSPQSAVQSIGRLHRTAGEARRALADFWAAGASRAPLKGYELEELAEFLSGVKMDGATLSAP